MIIVAVGEETGSTANRKGQRFISSSVLFCLFFSPSLLEVPDCYVWLTSRSLWQLSTHTARHSLVATLEKFQYLGFSSSYLKFPLVCEMGTFSLTDQQQ